MAYQIGDTIEVTVTAIQPYGAFVKVDKQYTGLIHISEISYGFVKDVEQFVKVGDKIKVKVLEIDEPQKHLKLSIKALARSREYQSKLARKKNEIDTVGEFAKLKENLPIWIEKTNNQQ